MATADLQTKLHSLFRKAEAEAFRDGVESAFARQLVTLVNTYGDVALNQVALLVQKDAIAPEVLAEVLRWLGHMGGGVAADQRRRLLESALQNPSICVREGAILGISFLENPQSISLLKAALLQEPYATLHADMQQVIDDLQEA